jgi:hypothetical protein
MLQKKLRLSPRDVIHDNGWKERGDVHSEAERGGSKRREAGLTSSGQAVNAERKLRNALERM